MLNPAGDLLVMAPMLTNPLRDKWLHRDLQVLEALGSLLPGKLPELPEDRHTAVHIASRIAVLSKPLHIALNRSADPRGAKTVYGVGLQEKTF